MSDLEHRVSKSQSNVNVIEKAVGSWVLQPIFMRKDGKKETLLSLEDKKEKLKKLLVDSVFK